jgi:hypothetical protein
MIIPESDWKKFKPLRDKALARLCDRILSEIAATSAEEALSSHEKYLKIYSQIPFFVGPNSFGHPKSFDHRCPIAIHHPGATPMGVTADIPNQARECTSPSSCRRRSSRTSSLAVVISVKSARRPRRNPS